MSSRTDANSITLVNLTPATTYTIIVTAADNSASKIASTPYFDVTTSKEINDVGHFIVKFRYLIYRVSIKSLYNLKKLLKSEMMRYRNEVCFMLISIS